MLKFDKRAQCAFTLLSSMSIGLISPNAILHAQELTNADTISPSSSSGILDGTWQLEKHIWKGEVAALLDLKLRFNEGYVELITNGQINSRYAVQLDLTKTPHQIDLTEIDTKDNKNRVSVIRGIFEIRGDTLVWISTSADDVSRPDQLVSKKDNPYSINRFKRVGPQPPLVSSFTNSSPKTPIAALPQQNITLPAIKNGADLEAAYKQYRKHNYKAAHELLTQILSKDDDFDALAIATRIQFHESLTDRMAAAVKDSNTNASIIYTDIVDAVSPIYSKLIAIAEKNPRSAIAQELLGEVASEFAVFLESFTDIQKTATDSQHLRTTASNAYLRSVELNPTRAIPHLRIAASMIKENGDRSDSIIAEHLLQGIENSPDDPACIDLLVIVMWNTSMLEDEQIKDRVMRALKNVSGDAVDELRVAQMKTRKLLDLGYVTLERFAAAGDQLAQIDESISRLRRALAIVDAAL